MLTKLKAAHIVAEHEVKAVTDAWVHGTSYNFLYGAINQLFVRLIRREQASGPQIADDIVLTHWLKRMGEAGIGLKPGQESA